MALILLFLFTTGLLEVGQSNWDVLNLDCFGNLYTPLYNWLYTSQKILSLHIVLYILINNDYQE